MKRDKSILEFNTGIYTTIRLKVNPELYNEIECCFCKKVRDEYTNEEILIREEKEKLLEDINFYLENYIPKNSYEEKIKNERNDSLAKMLLNKKKNYLKYKIKPFNKQFKYKEDISQYFKKYIPETPYEKFMKDNLHDEWSEFLWKKQEYHKLFENREMVKAYNYEYKESSYETITRHELHLEMYEISFYHRYYTPKNEEELKLKQGPYLEYEKFLKEKQKEDLSAHPTDFVFDELGYQEDINWYIKHQKPRSIIEKFFKENMHEWWLQVLKDIQRESGILCGKIDDYI